MCPFDFAGSGEKDARSRGRAAPAPAASDPGVVALRTALQDLLIGEPPDADLERAAHLFCREGHRRGLALDEVVGATTQAWYSLPELQYLPNGGFRAGLLDHLVRLVVEEY